MKPPTMLDLARAINPDGRMAAIIDALKGRHRVFTVVPFSEIKMGETFVFIAGKQIKWEKVGEPEAPEARRVGCFKYRRVDPSYRVYRVSHADESAFLPRIPWVDA